MRIEDRVSITGARPRYATLDAWRGLACLAVIAFHGAAQYVVDDSFLKRMHADGGDFFDWSLLFCWRLWAGVPLFFVISGYCIAAAAVNATEGNRSVASFLNRRIRRIYPPLWVFLILAAVVLSLLPDHVMPGPTEFRGQAIPRPQQLSWWHWLGQFTLTEEWREHIAGPPRRYFAGHLWTLCYEEQFYLVMTAVLAVARRWIFPAVALISAFVALRLIDVIVLPFAVDGFFFDGLWLAFASGVAVYYRCHRATPVLKFGIDGLLVAGIYWSARSIPDFDAFDLGIPTSLFLAFAAALLLGWCYPFDRFTANAKLSAPLRWCGERCYSLYLVHAMIANVLSWVCFRHGATTPARALLITLPISLAASLFAGWLFHRVVERRFLNSVSPRGTD